MQVVRRRVLPGSSSRNQEESGNQPATFTACCHLQKVEAPLISTHVCPTVQTIYDCMSRTSSLSSSDIPREDESIVYQGERQEAWPRPKDVSPGASQPICRPVGVWVGETNSSHAPLSPRTDVPALFPAGERSLAGHRDPLAGWWEPPWLHH